MHRTPPPSLMPSPFLSSTNDPTDLQKSGFFSPTRHPKPEHSGSGKPDRFQRKPVEIGQIPVQIQIVRRIWAPAGLTGIPAGLTGLPAGLTGNRSV